MRVLYVDRRRLRLRAVYVAALLLLAGSVVLFWPEETAPALAEPYYSGAEDSDMLSLAINVDWGNEYLPGMLEDMEEAGIKASFFLTGRWSAENPQLAAAIAAAGHEIGNHGYSHASPNASSIAEIVDEIERTQAAIKEACGVTTTLYAPPSGEREDHVLEAAQQAGHVVVLWSVDTIDWQGPDAATIIRRVTSKVKGGAIILAHPTEGTAAALPELIAGLEAEGYRFVTVSENLGI